LPRACRLQGTRLTEQNIAEGKALVVADGVILTQYQGQVPFKRSQEAQCDYCLYKVQLVRSRLQKAGLIVQLASLLQKFAK